MQKVFVIAAVAGLIGAIVLAYLAGRRQAKRDAEWESVYPRSRFPYCGKTILFYDPSHGNQIEYLDPNGRCYLWYPGNAGILAGRWKIDDDFIYFRYGLNSYNPVTGAIGGGWEPAPLAHWSATIIDEELGDPFDTRSKHLPYVMFAHPSLESLDNGRDPF